MTFGELWYHPLLQSSRERFFFPRHIMKHLNFYVNGWKERYLITFESGTIGMEATITNYAKRDVLLSAVWERISKDGLYGDNALGVFDFSINVATRVSNHLAITGGARHLVCTSA